MMTFNFQKRIFLILFFIFAFLLIPHLVLATGNANIKIYPNNGTYNKIFTVSVVVDGGGEVFNAAQAKVNVSSNLSVTDLTLGDCNFSFLSTPSILNPSFSGVILGGSSQKCTVYTLTLVPIKKGSSTTITLSGGNIKRYGDATNILSSMQSGTYNITGEVLGTKSMIEPTPFEAGYYTVVLKILTTESHPLNNVTVILKSASTKNQLQSKTNKDGLIQFTNIQPGIYEATVVGYKGSTILNIQGNNHTLTLSMKVPSQYNSIIFNLMGNPILLITIGIIIGFILSILFVFYKIKQRL